MREYQGRCMMKTYLSETECNPDAEFDRQENTIVIYWPKAKNKKWIIQSLIHEYQHYLQSPIWFKRYYKMGYEYDTHPLRNSSNPRRKHNGRYSRKYLES